MTVRVGPELRELIQVGTGGDDPLVTLVIDPGVSEPDEQCREIVSTLGGQLESIVARGTCRARIPQTGLRRLDEFDRVLTYAGTPEAAELHQFDM